MVGNLTMRGVTKPVSFDVTMNGPVAHPDPKNKTQQLGIEALATVKRSDFALSRLPGDWFELRRALPYAEYICP